MKTSAKKYRTGRLFWSRLMGRVRFAIMLAAEILATKTAAIRTNFAAESVSQILAK